MTLGSHQKTVGTSQAYITPRWIISALGPFDLDPCAASPRPWDCAKQNLTEAQDGLSFNWYGARVWLNPPFDRYGVERWIEKLARHGRGTALLHARTETEWFQWCWRHASAFLFMAGRITFCRQDGSTYEANSGAPPVLVAFGNEDANRLGKSPISGAFVHNWKTQ